MMNLKRVQFNLILIIKIEDLLNPYFKIISCELNSRLNFLGKNVGESRWHVITKKNKL